MTNKKPAIFLTVDGYLGKRLWDSVSCLGLSPVGSHVPALYSSLSQFAHTLREAEEGVAVTTAYTIVMSYSAVNY